MPENRKAPWRYLPKLGAPLHIAFGDSQELNLALREKLESWRQDKKEGETNFKSVSAHHAELTAIVERAIDNLGSKVSKLRNI
jgi:hypothetical protein